MKFQKQSSREAVVQRCSVQKIFLKFSQNSQENTCARVSFLIKLLRLATLLKKRLWHRCFSRGFCEIFKNIFFTEHLQRLLLKFISNHTKEILHVNTNLMGNQPRSKNRPVETGGAGWAADPPDFG